MCKFLNRLCCFFCRRFKTKRRENKLVDRILSQALDPIVEKDCEHYVIHYVQKDDDEQYEVYCAGCNKPLENNEGKSCTRFCKTESYYIDDSQSENYQNVVREFYDTKFCDNCFDHFEKDCTDDDDEQQQHQQKLICFFCALKTNKQNKTGKINF